MDLLHDPLHNKVYPVGKQAGLKLALVCGPVAQEGDLMQGKQTQTTYLNQYGDTHGDHVHGTAMSS